MFLINGWTRELANLEFGNYFNCRTNQSYILGHILGIHWASFNEKPGYYRLLLSVVTINLRLGMYSKLFYECTVHFRPGKIYHWKKVSTVYYCRGYYTFLLQVYAKTEATNWRLTSKCTAHIGPRKHLLLLVVSDTKHSKQQEVIMYAYHKLVAKKGSHKLTAHIM